MSYRPLVSMHSCLNSLGKARYPHSGKQAENFSMWSTKGEMPIWPIYAMKVQDRLNIPWFLAELWKMRGLKNSAFAPSQVESQNLPNLSLLVLALWHGPCPFHHQGFPTHQWLFLQDPLEARPICAKVVGKIVQVQHTMTFELRRAADNLPIKFAFLASELFAP
jgi:hypothetical protein